MQHPFLELKSEYEQLLSVMKVTQPVLIDRTARKLLDISHRPRLEIPAKATGVPFVLWATLCERESGCRFDRNPAQGDPLTGPSTHVPKGRPPLGPPPNDHFPVSYEYAAEDAIEYDHLNDLQGSNAWTLPYACWKGEAWNGFGPRNHGRHTGYLWAGTNVYNGGKYVADGQWNPNASDAQLGIIPVMLRMIELDPGTAFSALPIMIPAAYPQAPVPTPLGVGQPADAHVIQHALNLKGFGPLLEDGSYGRRTREAVRAFQVANHLTADGLAGPQTLKVLLGLK